MARARSASAHVATGSSAEVKGCSMHASIRSPSRASLAAAGWKYASPTYVRVRVRGRVRVRIRVRVMRERS